jgi:hypothetical protein
LLLWPYSVFWSLVLLFLLRIALLFGFFMFPYHFIIDLSIFVKNDIGIFNGVAFNQPLNCFHHITIITILILFILLFSSISSFIYNFHCSCVLPSELSLFLGIFEAIVNGIVLLIFFSLCSLLVYRKATDFIYWFSILLCSWKLYQI